MSETSSLKTIRLGLAGLGTVGSAVARHLRDEGRLLAGRSGFRFEIARIAVRDKARHVAAGVDPSLLTTSWRELVETEGIDLVVELMGGEDEARSCLLAALEKGISVVTANKALLAAHGAELFAVAERTAASIFFEAAVAGGIPVIKAVKESLVGNHISAIHGIINGTGNYILTRMTEAGLGFTEALEEASAKGYAEADPTLDVNGWDAAHKAIILASLAYGYWVAPEDLRVEGIDRVARQDIGYAARLGYVIKHVGVIKAGNGGGEVEVRVQPSLLPREHTLASVGGVTNALAIRGDLIGESLFVGPGAGGDATASSVISDIVDAAHSLDKGPRNAGFVPHGLYGRTKPAALTVSEFYLRIPVRDQPGVIACIAGILAAREIGISATVSLAPSEMPDGKFNEVILMTHEAPLGLMEEAVAEVARETCVTGPPVLLRVEKP